MVYVIRLPLSGLNMSKPSTFFLFNVPVVAAAAEMGIFSLPLLSRTQIITVSQQFWLNILDSLKKDMFIFYFCVCS